MSRVLPRILRAVPSARVRTSFGRAAQQSPQPPQPPPPPSPLLERTAIVVPWLIAVNCAIFGLWDVRPLREWMYGNFSLSVESMRSGRYHTMRTACESNRGLPMCRWCADPRAHRLCQSRVASATCTQGTSAATCSVTDRHSNPGPTDLQID